MTRGVPDYSHWDYAAEAVRNREYFRRIGAADRAAGQPPNHYNYYVGAVGYSIADGYRGGYGPVVSTSINKEPAYVAA